MKTLKTIALGMTLLASASIAEAADYTAQYVDLGHQSAALYQPTAPSENSKIGVIVMHSHHDYMNFIANSELASGGYTVLGSSVPSEDNLEPKILAVKNCVEYLRNRDDIQTVVLLGHSGGATLMTAYQYLAENGRKGLEGKIYQEYTSAIDSLPKADGIMLLDANPGISTVTLNSIDPNITDESTGFITDKKYDYSNECEYMAGQQQRYSRLVDEALARLDTIKAGKGKFADDEPLVIPGAQSIRFYNKLYSSDTNLLSHTKDAHPLLHADGSITNEIVHSVRAPFQPIDQPQLLSAAQNLTVKNFPSVYAITVDDDYEVTPTGFKGIHFNSNLTSPIGNIEGIYVPSLFMGMTGSYEYLTAEYLFDNSPAEDKTMAFVEGAGHMFNADKNAEKYNNADYGDTVKVLFDYVALWLAQTFK